VSGQHADQSLTVRVPTTVIVPAKAVLRGHDREMRAFVVACLTALVADLDATLAQLEEYWPSRKLRGRPWPSRHQRTDPPPDRLGLPGRCRTGGSVLIGGGVLHETGKNRGRLCDQRLVIGGVGEVGVPASVVLCEGVVEDSGADLEQAHPIPTKLSGRYTK
jgi:hypothetical protein